MARFMQELEGMEDENNTRLAKCECGGVMEVTSGAVDYNAKDDMGQVMSPEACEHMAEYRVRCVYCEQNFCCNCN